MEGFGVPHSQALRLGPLDGELNHAEIRPLPESVQPP